METYSLFWMAEQFNGSVSGYSIKDGTKTNDIIINWFVKIIDKTNYSCLVELFLDDELLEKFKMIMKYDRVCLQYLQHPMLCEAAKVKLKQSPHHKIMSLSEATLNQQYFYLF
jgi:hypothetical protein